MELNDIANLPIGKFKEVVKKLNLEQLKELLPLLTDEEKKKFVNNEIRNKEYTPSRPRM